MGSNVYKNSLARINFQQPIAATTWTIVHGIGTTAPAVDVYVLQGGSYSKIVPKHVIATDANTVTITFSQAFAGYATVM